MQKPLHSAIMKTRITALSLITGLFLTGCINRPDAGFTVDEKIIYLGEAIEFINISHEGVSFQWNFDDGNISTDANPVHRYDASGNYTVELMAFSKEDVVDRAYMDISVLPEYVLDVLVYEYYDEYAVAGASVRLYPTLEDWDNETNMVAEGITDNDGIVVFTGLGPNSYYLDIWEENHDNYQLRDEDADQFIKTQVLTNTDINYYDAAVDYYSSKKSAVPRERGIKSTKGPRVVKIIREKMPE